MFDIFDKLYVFKYFGIIDVWYCVLFVWSVFWFFDFDLLVDFFFCVFLFCFLMLVWFLDVIIIEVVFVFFVLGSVLFFFVLMLLFLMYVLFLDIVFVFLFIMDKVLDFILILIFVLLLIKVFIIFKSLLILFLILIFKCWREFWYFFLFGFKYFKKDDFILLKKYIVFKLVLMDRMFL